MFEQKRAYWRQLDNAGKLFSAASSAKDTRVFRFYCELKEEVKPELLSYTQFSLPDICSLITDHFVSSASSSDSP